MLTLLALAAVYAGYRAVRGALRTLRELPSRNDDMVFF